MNATLTKMRGVEQDSILDGIVSLISGAIVSSTSNPRTGLIDYPPIQRRKIKTLSHHGMFYILKDDSRIVGFSDLYPRYALSGVFPNDDLIKYLKLFDKKDFAYINMLVIDRKYRNQGLGRMLLNRIAEDCSGHYEYLLGAILHKPYMNVYSSKMVKHAGFVLESEYRRGWHVFGVYKKNLQDHNS